MAVMKRARMERAMVTAMRVPVDEEGEGGMGHGVDDNDDDDDDDDDDGRWRRDER